MPNKMMEVIEQFEINYMAIQGSTDDVDIIDRDTERLLEQFESSLKSILKESMPKKLKFIDSKEGCGCHECMTIETWNDALTEVHEAIDKLFEEK